METANLGALTAGLGAEVGPSVLAKALVQLADVPSFVPDVTAWARMGFAARAHILAAYDAPGAAAAAGNHPAVPATLGLPTWFYGQEPTNVFAAGIAKFSATPCEKTACSLGAGRGSSCCPGPQARSRRSLRR